MVLVSLGFHKRKNLSENFPQLWSYTLKNFRQPCPRPKKLKEYPSGRLPNYLSARRTHVTQPALCPTPHKRFLPPWESHNLRAHCQQGRT